MLVCQICQKGINKQSYSRHKKGSSGASGTWNLRAPIHSKIQRPNVHNYRGMRLCTKCLRAVQKVERPQDKTSESVST
ncbi:hypothetical protein M1563_04935 [Patescibacteria group bacterium]|nr:hypothetical protein [Patescibacteria group bacterium]MCL5409453.1 hypothetical protein [Patescibacteria group bacterium]